MAAGAVLAVLLVAAAVASLQLAPASPRHTDTVHDLRVAADGDPTASASPAPVPTRPAERAGRSTLRSAPPSPPPSPSPTSPRPTTPRPTRATPPGGGPVSGSGTCGASYYTDDVLTASGEPFDPSGFTAAHKMLPFNTRVRVTNLANNKSTIVRINDRGPFVSGRCIDLTRAAFGAIASLSSGVINVRYEILG
jgi:rare lipoprotein A